MTQKTQISRFDRRTITEPFPLELHQYFSRVGELLGLQLSRVKTEPYDRSIALTFNYWQAYQDALGKKEAIARRVGTWGYRTLDLEFKPPRKINYQRMWELGAYPNVEFGAWDLYGWQKPDCDLEPETYSMLC